MIAANGVGDTFHIARRFFYQVTQKQQYLMVAKLFVQGGVIGVCGEDLLIHVQHRQVNFDQTGIVLVLLTLQYQIAGGLLFLCQYHLLFNELGVLLV